MPFNRHHKLITLLLITLVTGVSDAQDIKESVTHYFNKVRTGSYPSIPNELLIPENASAAFSLMQPYLKDSISAVRGKAYEIIYLVSTNSPIPIIRKQGSTILVNACRETDSGNTGLVLDYLSKFAKEDFTQSAKDSIRNHIRTQASHFDQLIKLAGFLHLTDLREDIRPYAQPGNPSQMRWAAILSLARMGESPAIQEMMKRVTRLPVNDDLVYEVFPDLIYTRQREAIQYLIKVMNSDAKDCMAADAEREIPIVCGYRVMEQLAPVIEDYPLELDESGDLKTNDYPRALTTVRQWFKTHEGYTVLNDRF